MYNGLPFALATDLLIYFPQPRIVLWRRNKIIRQISRAWSLRGGGRVDDGSFHLQDHLCLGAHSIFLCFLNVYEKGRFLFRGSSLNQK